MGPGSGSGPGVEGGSIVGGREREGEEREREGERERERGTSGDKEEGMK